MSLTTIAYAFMPSKSRYRRRTCRCLQRLRHLNKTVAMEIIPRLPMKVRYPLSVLYRLTERSRRRITIPNHQIRRATLQCRDITVSRHLRGI